MLMNIRFHNLGKIKETELDLKPMTVIIGPNNSNKTYIAYSVYGLWQSMTGTSSRYPRSGIPFQKGEGRSLSITVEALHKAFVTNIQLSLKGFESELETFYQDSSQSLFSKTRYEIGISANEFSDAIQTLSGKKLELFTSEYSILVHEDVMDLTYVGSENVLEEVRRSETAEVGQYLLLLLRKQLILRPYLMPAERNAFVITYKVLANRRLKLLLDAQRRLFTSNRKKNDPKAA